MKTSTQLVCITWLLVGTLTSIAAAQTVEPETNPSTTADATMSGDRKTLAEVEQTTNIHIKTDLPYQELEPPTALTPPDISPNATQTPQTVQAHFPKTVEELDPPPRTLSEAGFPSQTLSQQTPPPPPDITPETAPTPQTSQAAPLRFTPRIGGRFTTGPGVGYESSFGGIEGFVPLQQTSRQNLTFLEGRFLLSTDDAQPGGNVILGHRVYSAKNNRTFGGYVAYDIRDTGNSVFNQLGVGVETLGEFWDVRANAYIPIGDNRKQVEESSFIRSVSPFAQPSFQGNSLFIGEGTRQIDQSFEAAMTGFDAEGGVRIIRLGERGHLWGYAGLYYYDAPGTSDLLGGRFRLEARPTDTVRVGLALQTDDNFGTNVVVSVAANFPGTRPRGIEPQEEVLARLGESVVRQENIVVDEQFESSTVQEAIALTNSDSDEPLVFRHVNLGTGTGSGTFETPAGTVAEALAVAQPNDIIYVQAGTNPGIPGFTIPDQVQVLSSGPVQVLGNTQLPLSGTGVRPLIVGTVTLGNDNTLSGFEINGAVGSGIRGTGINNTTIQGNVITNSTTADSSNLGHGIFLMNVTGEIDITGNAIANNSENGILIESNSGEVDLTIESNAIAENFNAISTRFSGNAQGTAEITNNSISNSGNVDIQLSEDSQLDDLTISSNTINSPESQGINFEAFDNAQATVTVSNNTIANITGDGSATGDGMNFALNQNSRTELTISGNTIANATDDGIDLNLFDNAQGTVTITNNQISNANSGGVGFSNIGIEVDADNDSRLQLLIESNTITGSSEQGISIFSGAGGGSPQISTSVRLNTLTGNNVSGLASGGFDAQTLDTSRMCLQLRNNTSDTFVLANNGGTFQVETGTNTGTVNQTGTTAAPPFVDCTVP